jgi:4-amino-4-deoxy-L-arabinose transferase-like glycosyltransferase
MRRSHGELGFLGTVVGAAAIFRVAYVLQYRAESVFSAAPMLDAAVFHAWAQRIAGGEWLPVAPFYFPPGYPYALALIQRAAGPSLAAVYAVQLVLGLLGIVLVHRLALLAFGARAARVAAALTALYATFPFLETKLLASTMALTALLGALVVLASAAGGAATWRWGCGGLLLGLTSLGRPETLVTTPFLVAWAWRWAGRPEGGGRRRKAAALGMLAVGWAAAVAPVVLHNVRTGGGLTLISSQAAVTFYQGNNPRARGLYVGLESDGLSGMPERQAAEEKAVAEEKAGRSLTRAEVSAYWFGRGLDFIRDHPGAWLRLLGMKLLRFLGSYEYSTEYVLAAERRTVWLLWLPFVPFGLLVALAIPTLARVAGAPEAEGSSAVIWLLVAVLAANATTVLVFYVSSRYRLASVPPLLVLSSATVVSLVDALRAGRRRRACLVAAAVGLVFAAVHPERDASGLQQEAAAHFNAGNVASERGELALAVASYRRAIALDARPFRFWLELGNALRQAGQPAAAAEAYGEAARRRPEPGKP